MLGLAKFNRKLYKKKKLSISSWWHVTLTVKFTKNKNSKTFQSNEVSNNLFDSIKHSGNIKAFSIILINFIERRWNDCIFVLFMAMHCVCVCCFFLHICCRRVEMMVRCVLTNAKWSRWNKFEKKKNKKIK